MTKIKKDRLKKSNDLFLGKIYEFHCFLEIAKANPNIKFVKSKIKSKVGIVKNGFCYGGDGRVYYKNNGIHLAEFDALGICGDQIFWWEFTRSKKLKQKFKLKICKKSQLIKKLFPERKVNLIVALPFEKDFEFCQSIIIKEPNYSDFNVKKFENEVLNLPNLITISRFKKIANNYNYIENLIELSKKFFKNPKKISRLYPLIERIYNLDEILKDEINFYDFERKNFGKIIFKNNKMFKNGKKAPQHKATFKEITAIRKILKRQNLSKFG